MNSLLEKRYSPRDFDASHEISAEEAISLIQAAQIAPSSYNEQPWKFFYALRQNTDGFARLYDTIMDGNKPWSGDVSMLVCGVAKKHFDRNGKPNRHASYDLGQAVMSMVVQASDLGLHAHQMGGFSTSKAGEALGLDENWDPFVMVAIGKTTDTAAPERKRRALDEISAELK